MNHILPGIKELERGVRSGCRDVKADHARFTISKDIRKGSPGKQ